MTSSFPATFVDMKSVKVLASDGGGIRVIIPAVILSEIEKRLGGDLYRSFDLISVISTGGIIARGIGTLPVFPDRIPDPSN
jgi:patatin-like phospholipase/acyl hydrolase